ncbi:MAG: hypothetical protein Kow0077_23180 [Anaerolineae bacterium]
MTTFKQLAFGALIMALLGGLLAAGGQIGGVAVADDPPGGTITVPGYGTANGSPDIAYVTLGVEMRDPALSVAMQAADDAMAAVLAALQAAGIAAEDIQTVDFSVWSEESFGPEGPAAEASRAYRVAHIVRVTVRDTAQVQAVVDAGVRAGANRIHGVSFGLDNPAALEATARLDALADARDRAEQIAAAIGATLGEVVTVSEGGAAAPMPMVEAARGMGGGGIQQGQLSVGVQVQVTFAIVR